MTLTQLRKVIKPGARRGQARWVPGDPRDRNPYVIVNDRLSGLVAYTVIPRLQAGKPVEVRWTYLRVPAGHETRMTPWVTVTSNALTSE